MSRTHASTLSNPLFAVATALLMAITGLAALAPPAAAALDIPLTDSPLYVHAHPVRKLEYDAWADRLWIAMERVGLLRVSVDGSERVLLNNVDGLPANDVYDIAPVADRVYLGTQVGLVAWLRDEHRFIRYPYTDGGETMTDKVMTLSLEGSTLWIGTERAGLFQLTSTDGPLKAVNNPANGSRFAHPIRGVAASGPELWVSATEYGVVRWDRSTGAVRHYSEPFVLFTEKPFTGPVEIRGPDVWIGTGGEGARLYNRSTQQWRAFANPDNLNSYWVLDVRIIGGEVWFATVTGVARYTYATDAWTHWDSGNGFPGSKSTSMAFGQGRIWADSPRGIVEYDRLTGAWELTGYERFSDGLPWSSVNDCDIEGNRMLLSTGGGGAAWLDLASGVYDFAYPLGKVGESGIPDILVWSSDVTPQSVWFATEFGVARQDRATNQWHYYRTDGATPNNVRADRVTKVITGAGTAWIATATRGLGMYDATLDRFIMYNHTHGLSSPYVIDLAADGDHIWVATAFGLDRFDATTRSIEHIFPSTGYKTVASVVVGANEIYFGTADGVMSVAKDTLEASPLPNIGDPASRVLLDGERLWVGTPNGPLDLVPLSGEPMRRFVVPDFTPMKFNCMARHGSLLYIGTSWGLHRFHVDQLDWLRQQGLIIPAPPPPPSIAITSPGTGSIFELGASVTVAGTVEHAPAGAIVELRVGLGRWHSAAPGGSFSQAIGTQFLQTGDTTVTARLVSDGAIVAEDIVLIRLNPPATGAEGDPAPNPTEPINNGGQSNGGSSDPATQGTSAVLIDHVPPLEAQTKDPILLTVTLSRALSGVRIEAFVEDMAGQRAPLAFAPASATRYTATIGPFPTPGVVHYQIEVHWSDGAQLLPAPGSAYGESYPLAVRTNAGYASLFIPAEALRVETVSGTSREIEIPLQNGGTRSVQVDLALGGPAAPWLEGMATRVTVPAFSTVLLRANLTTPSDAGAGPHDVSLEFRGLDASTMYEATLEIVSAGGGENAGEVESTEGAPGLAPWLLGAALVFAGVLRRRREGA